MGWRGLGGPMEHKKAQPRKVGLHAFMGYEALTIAPEGNASEKIFDVDFAVQVLLVFDRQVHQYLTVVMHGFNLICIHKAGYIHYFQKHGHG